MSDIVERLRVANESMSVREIGAQIGISHGTVSRIMRGKNADLSTLTKVLEWLGMTIAPADEITRLRAEVERLRAAESLVLEILEYGTAVARFDPDTQEKLEAFCRAREAMGEGWKEGGDAP